MQLNGDTYEKGFFRARDQRYTRTMKMQLKVGGCTVRAAFSHIPFWQSAIWMGQQIVMKPCQGNIATGGSLVEQMDKVCLPSFNMQSLIRQCVAFEFCSLLGFYGSC